MSFRDLLLKLRLDELDLVKTVFFAMGAAALLDEAWPVLLTDKLIDAWVVGVILGWCGLVFGDAYTRTLGIVLLMLCGAVLMYSAYDMSLSGVLTVIATLTVILLGSLRITLRIAELREVRNEA